MDTLISLFTGSIGGGILGLAGSVVTSIFNYKQKKLEKEEKAAERAHELLRIKAEQDRELAVLQAETEAKKSIVETQTKGAIDLEEMKAYSESQKSSSDGSFSTSLIEKLANIDKDSPWTVRWIVPIVVSGLGVVSMVKEMMRPLISTYYVVLTTYITSIAWDIVQRNEKMITATDAWNVVEQVINTVLFLTVTCVTWWFADRQTSKFLMEKYK